MRYLSLLLVGALVNSVGSGLTAFGLGVFAYNAYGTASAVALVQLCAFAPIVLLAPLAGALADRFDRRLMMLLGDGCSVIGLGVVMVALGSPTPRLAYVLAGGHAGDRRSSGPPRRPPACSPRSAVAPALPRPRVCLVSPCLLCGPGYDEPHSPT